MHQKIRLITFASPSRTPIGALNGGLASIPSHELGSAVIKAVLESTKVSPEEVSEVILGQVLACGQGQNPARQAAINAGLPDSVPAMVSCLTCVTSHESHVLTF